jgi:hypothetical protein
MASDEMERTLNAIGNELAKDQKYPLDGTFLYTECTGGSVSTSIFKDLGDHLLFRLPGGVTDNIPWLILELWEAAPADRRWATMQYRIEDGTFTASFAYPEEIDAEEPEGDRRDRILHQRYGNKRIVYPPI